MRSCLVLLTCLLMQVSARGSQAWGIVSGNSTSIVLHPIDATNGAVGTALASGGSLLFTNVDDLASDPIRYPG
jgi:hypothetical protein